MQPLGFQFFVKNKAHGWQSVGQNISQFFCRNCATTCAMVWVCVRYLLDP
jgi:hypothetical protein